MVTVGIVSSILKGGGYEEVIFFAIFLIVLQRAKPAFDRRAEFFAARFYLLDPGYAFITQEPCLPDALR
jgi:hypothetical protein